MKRIISLCGLVGLAGCFLPLAFGMSLFDLRHFSESWSAWLVMAAFAVPAAIGASQESEKVAAIAGVASFGYLAYKFGTGGTFDLMIHGSLGGLAVGAAMIAGLCFSGLGLFASSQTKR